jgi:hypothetical protein
MVVHAETPDPVERRLVRTSEAPDLGISARQLAGPLWQQIWRGIHLRDDENKTDPDVRVQAVAKLLPAGVALGGWAALYARKVHELDGRIGLGGKLRDIVVCTGPVELTAHRKGLIVDRGRIPDNDLSVCSGVLLVSPERAICQIARRDGAELGLAAADAACRAGVTSPARLREFVATQQGRPGVPAMRLVARLVDPRSASIPESHLRYIWVVLAGLPIPLVNARIVDESGFLLGEPDLFDRAAALVGEYDGATHRELVSHTNDNNREEGFEGGNLTVVRATSIDIWPRRNALIRRIQDGQARGLARDRSRDRWQLRTA